MASSPAVWLVYALLFVGVLMGFEGLRLLVLGDDRSRRRAAVDRLKRHASRLAELDPAEGSILLEQEGASWLDWAANALPQRRSLELLLYRSGMGYTLPQFIGISVVLTIAGFAFGAVVMGSLLPGFGLSMVGFIPLLVVYTRKRARMKRFELQLPEALDLMCRALRAGISLEFGFRSTGDELPDPVGTEFAQVADEISLGLDTRVALQNLAMRMNTNDMPFFINAIMIQRETGGNLAEILSGLSHVIRERIKFYGRVKSLLAQVSATANVLGVLPVATYALISAVNPEYIEPLRSTEGGRLALIACFVMVPIGWVICRRIASVDV